MEIYNLNFITPHTICSNFKEKDVIYINNIISRCRLGEKISFNCTGNICFNDEDKYHFNPVCIKLDEYNKQKSNCLIYNITDISKYNPYNKIFIYQIIYKNSDNNGYGYILFNDETNKCTHVPTLSTIIDELIIKINSSLINQKRYRELERIFREKNNI